MGVVRFYPDQVLIVDQNNPDQIGYTAEKMGSTYNISSSLRALIHFTIPAEYMHRKLVQYRWGLYMVKYDYTPDPSYTGFAIGNWLASGFDNGVTYNTKPEAVSGASSIITPDYQIEGYYYSSYDSVSQFSKDLVLYWNNGVEFWGVRNFWTSTSQNQPVLEIDMAAEELLPTVSGSPSGGYMPKQADNRFTWAVTMPPEYYTFKGWEVSGQAFEWKYTDAAEWTHIDVSESEYTIPANTLAGDIVWRAVVTVTDGSRTETIYTSEYSINTTEPLGSATPVSPKNTITDGSKPITLRWRYYNSSGRQQNGADIQWGVSGGTWQDLTHVTGSTQTYTVPADFFPAGAIYWRTRAYNLDGAVGSWSAQITFTNRAAPPAPIVTSNGAPYATINWQSEGQEAWRLTVDGKEYGTRYGYDNSFTLTEPLEDGQHTASVVVQNSFGLWSQPGTLVFDVENVPGAAVTLTGVFGIDAELQWTEAAAGTQSDDFQVFRDGVQIGHTTGTQFTDRIALGEHSWYVVAMLPNGNYTKSNTVTGTVTIEEPVIGALNGSGEWIKLALSDRSATVQEFSSERTVNYRHYAGAEYPVLEMAPFKDKSGRYDVSFKDPAEAAAFEALFGQVVILKSRRGNVIVGPLATLSKRETDFYTAFSFQIQQIHWEEIIDDT